ncbi:hypothetical protein ABTY53_30875 [Streptomyces noursei]|uniref:hypothetical protein n=1 Tax=Streptomyces noursei TaxID=1971 RepID=UPI003332521C
MPSADVFSLAGVLVFAATGHGPFGDAPGTEVLHRIVNDEPDLGGVPAPLTDLLAACLAKDPADRPGLTDVLQRIVEPDRPATQEWPAGIATRISERQAPVRATARRPGRRACRSLRRAAQESG